VLTSLQFQTQVCFFDACYALRSVVFLALTVGEGLKVIKSCY